MKQRFITISAMVVLLATCLGPSAHAANAPATAQNRVSAFYAWYIALNAKLALPLTDQGITRFVARDTVARLRRDYEHDRLPDGVDYFLKVQDSDDADWLAHMDAKSATLLDNVAIVPVSFGSKNKSCVVVFLRKIDGQWMITKVDGTSDYR